MCHLELMLVMLFTLFIFIIFSLHQPSLPFSCSLLRFEQYLSAASVDPGGGAARSANDHLAAL
ncbi:uncharacterized protein P174DRAFT_304806 [Aspergillus novofumigatus IBT 16806]|uniref:Uncharacterized protein n=1 Tax=Aspergillus novofumigatus (strain IBT 16806) TaxID=1392255 RepID=A0A2I1BWG6_ASPN1|nr:uncharacterized protein P174DRAFT_304806 [Aspergillus novofumigatus IBT 16806]PKX89706.1 hypothetical protein P174DRAFT_304806 [Aspergillus novofumigatus IBT 16806]